MKKLIATVFIITATLNAVLLVTAQNKTAPANQNAANQIQSETKLLSPSNFKTSFEKNTNAVLLDVRTPEEYKAGHIDKAINMNYNADDFETQISKLDKNKSYFLYCKKGGRSAGAAELMQSKGFKYLFDLDGGINAWQVNKLPVKK